MLRKILSKCFAYFFYASDSRDWYRSKGYAGQDDEEVFYDFLRRQSSKDGTFYNCFRGLALERFKVETFEGLLDCVSLTQVDRCDIALPGIGKLFVMFYGRGECYESRFRDMALLCKATGAEVIGFNYKGVSASSGSNDTLDGIVDDGKALICHLLDNGYQPHDIIMLGNCLGGVVQQMVCAEFRRCQIHGFREVNVSSFRNFGAVVSYKIRVPIMEKFISKLLKYASWEVQFDEDSYKVGLSRIHLRKYRDRTVLPGAEFHDAVDIEDCITKLPITCREELAWIMTHNQLVLREETDVDPHNAALNNFIVKQCYPHDEIPKDAETAFGLIRRYLEISNRYASINITV